MSAFEQAEVQHQAYLCLGSNIHPEENLRKAIELLRARTRVLALSNCWESEAIGANGPNFLNIGASILTPLDPEALKTRVLRPIENELGRVRSADKYAPRTMDLDITVFDGQVLDPELWRRAYLAVIFAELLPDLRHPETSESIEAVAERLKKGKKVVIRQEMMFS